MNKIGSKMKETARRIKLFNFIAITSYMFLIFFMTLTALCYHVNNYVYAGRFTFAMSACLAVGLFYDKKAANYENKQKILRRRLVTFERRCRLELQEEAA